MPEYTYRNVSNAFFSFGSISKHLHCTKSQLLLQDPGPT